MRKLQGVKWNNTYKNNENINYFDGSIYGISEMILAMICTILFVVSSNIIFSDVFQWANFSGISFVLMIIIALIVSFAMDLSVYAGKKGKYISVSILFLGLLMFALYIFLFEDFTDIFDGFSEMIALYMKDWSEFYKTKSFMTIRSVETAKAYNIFLLIIFFVLMWLVKMTRKNMIAVVMPLLALLTEFLIGKWPGSFAMVLMLIGITISNTMSWKKTDFVISNVQRRAKEKKKGFLLWIIVGMVTLSVWGVVRVAGTASAKYFLSYSDDFKAARKEIVSVFKDITSSDNIIEFFENIASALFSNADNKTADLSNRKPKYNNKVVMELTFKSAPPGTIYLKGFDADVYDDGTWSKDIKSYESACKKAGYNPKEMSEKVLNIAVGKLLKTYNLDHFGQGSLSMKGEIKYVDSSGTKAYAPYFSEQSKGDIIIRGDATLEKERGTNKLSFYMWQYGIDEESLYYRFDSITKEDWERWYENYVLEHYLDVPKGMKNVENIAGELMAMDSYYTGFDENESRLDKAELVSEWMSENTRYSQNLPDLPSGADPVEYFLGTSKTGYCMHYASASVLILREMGVPARYVSGYIVPRDLFEYESYDCIAKVKDNKAHAWVEIYLNGVGWIPIEVTNGYSSHDGVTPADNVPDPDYEEETSKTDEEETTDDSDDYYEDDIFQDDNNDSDDNTDDEIDNEITTGDESQTQGEISGGNSILPFGDNKGGGSVDLTVLWMVLGITFGCVIIIGTPVAIVIFVKRSRYNHLQILINKKRTVRAVKYINRQIYKRLRSRGKTLKHDYNDVAYEEILKETYQEIQPDNWHRFMCIVKAAAFSRRDISEEEMYFCYDIINKVMKINKEQQS